VEDIPAAALRLGILESRLGEHEKAELTLKRAVELNGGNPRARAEAYLALARTALARGDRRGARGYATVVTALFDDERLCSEARKILESAE
jgi:tetratricopeptide (TPR) repeat protein